MGFPVQTVLVTGGKGMLARTLARVLARDCAVVPSDLPETDVTDAAAVEAAIAAAAPDAVVHCSGTRPGATWPSGSTATAPPTWRAPARAAACG